MVAESEVGMSNYLLLGSESALADRALLKLLTALRADDYEIATLYCEEAEVGDVAEALAPSLSSEKRALVMRDLQELVSDVQEEVIRFLDDPDPTMIIVFVHKGGVKGKALLDRIKKEKPELAKKFLDGLLTNPDLKAAETTWVEENLPVVMSGIVKDMNSTIASGQVGAVTPQEIATYKSQVGDIVKKTFEGASKEGKFKVEPPTSALDKTIAAVEGITKSMPAAQAQPTPPVAAQAQPAAQPAANNRRPASQPK